MYATWNPERGEAAIVRLADNAFISIASDNRDYQHYLGWLAQGNIPEQWNPEEWADGN